MTPTPTPTDSLPLASVALGTVVEFVEPGCAAFQATPYGKVNRADQFMITKTSSICASGYHVSEGAVGIRDIEFYSHPKPLVRVMQNGRRAAFIERLATQARKDPSALLPSNNGGTIGADPEIFVVDGERLVPAFAFLKNKTDSPQFFWDGFQAECTVAAYSCLSWLVDDVRNGFCHIRDAARVHVPNAQLTPVSTLQIPDELLTTAADAHVQLGCDPSYNLYNLPGEHVADGRALRWRFAGSHKHFGVGKQTPEQIAAIVRALDWIYGVSLVSLCEDLDHPARRRYYGRAGEYRLPKHGLEYRVPSSADLCHPAIYHLSWNLARMAMRVGQTPGLLPLVWDSSDEETIEVINNTDVSGARKIMDRNRQTLTGMLGRSMQGNDYITKTNYANEAYTVFASGVASLIADPLDMTTNWMLDKGEQVARHEVEPDKWKSHSNADAHCFAGWVRDNELRQVNVTPVSPVPPAPSTKKVSRKRAPKA